MEPSWSFETKTNLENCRLAFPPNLSNESFGLSRASVDVDTLESSRTPLKSVPEMQNELTKQFRQKMASLVTLHFSHWGSSKSVPWPIQLGRETKILPILRQIFRSSANIRLKHAEGYIFSVFEKSQSVKSLIEDMFWYFFLDYFALHSVLPLVDQFKRQAVNELRKEQQQSVLRQAERVIGTARSKVKQRRKKQKSTGTVPALQQPRDAAEVLMKKLTSRQRELPLHVRQHQEASQIVCPRQGKRQLTWAKFTADDDESDTASQCSSATSQASGFSLASFPESQTLTHETGLIQHSSPFSYNYPSRIDLEAAVDLLVTSGFFEESEDIDSILRASSHNFTDWEIAKAAPLTHVALQPNGRGEQLICQAIDLIKIEQNRMFGRMAKEYTTLFRQMKTSQQEQFFSFFPDLLARIVVQLVFRLVPYGREFFTNDVKKAIKGRITFWCTGVENHNTENWESPESAIAEVQEEFLKREARVRENKRESTVRKTAMIPHPPDSRRSSANGNDGTPLQKKVSLNESRTGNDLWGKTKNPVRALGKAIGSDGALTATLQELSYAESLSEMRQALEELRTGKKSSEELVSEESRNRFKHLRSTATKDLKLLYLNFHRHSPRNKHKITLWHEQGRKAPPLGVNLISNHQMFCVNDVTPFMTRFMLDTGITSALDARGPRLMSWSLPTE